ncbi:hypothetical protein [Streptomyces yangpuensis]|uniref:hypothetical protein n=1 Tax=Streptomyces yangpuensis TaxID=1648182 RepID=UPI003711BC7D
MVPDGPFRLRGEPVLPGREHAVQNAATAHRLWTLSERLTGVHCPVPTPAPART